MVPGFTEREAQAAEMRRQDLLAYAARERLAQAHAQPPAAGGSVPGHGSARRQVGAALVRIGQRLRHAAGPAVGDVTPAPEVTAR